MESLILSHCTTMHFGGIPIRAEVCATLQEAAKEPLFFEGLFYFAQKNIPFGEGYNAWVKTMNERMQAGQEIYFLGQGY